MLFTVVAWFASHRFVVLYLLAALGGASCDGCTACQQKKSFGGVLTAAEPESEVLGEVWKDASAKLKVTNAALGQSLRYKLPATDCQLGYQLRSRRVNNIPKTTRPPAGAEFLITVKTEDNPDDPKFMRFVAESIRKDSLAENKRTVGKAHPAEAFAPSRVRTDGLSLKEHSVPTTLWSLHASFPGLSYSFPDLPTQTALGSSALWQRRTVSSAALEAYISGIDKGMSPPKPRRSVKAIDVRLTRWIDVDKVRAGVLHAEWRDATTTRRPLKHRTVDRWKGRYTMLASGRLLHAIAIAETTSWWETKERENQKQTGSAQLELRLVSACDGPTLPGFEQQSAEP